VHRRQASWAPPRAKIFKITSLFWSTYLKTEVMSQHLQILLTKFKDVFFYFSQTFERS
jgi:hypothetical protein